MSAKERIENAERELRLAKQQLEQENNPTLQKIIELISTRSHVSRDKIIIRDDSKEDAVRLELHVKSFSGDGSLDQIFRETGLHVVQCSSGINMEYILLRFGR